ncbi:tyrosine-type recombinase/integrase [Paenibacillus cremeus]|uniref:Tyrosine-type recombinase/integrase n=1 Tax=Paenibacillus cremeus TaxID=2163881 RepID=A0A559KCY7_9BACL|nr:tyrosine-type recombinase/integrase [Paenibacillus cremeus]TVY09974.1 tyrosine-type recombinase/integrase [Paenibacillus cremeus]
MPRKTFKKQITSPELTEQINQKNKKLIDRFLKEKNTRCSDTTIEAYTSDLNIFFTWNLLNNENKFFIEIKKIEFADFFSYCVEELKWGSARFGRMKSCLSSLSEFIIRYYDEDHPNFRNVILKAIESMPRNPVREKTILSEEQVNSLLNHLKNEISRPQEACLLALAIASGARVSEWLRFTTDIIDENNTAFEDMFLETTKKIKTKGRTKTGKMIEKYIIKDIFLPYYKDWLVERERIMNDKGKDHNSIFIKRDGEPATVETVRGWIEKWELFLGVPFYPHCLRHFITTYMSRLGMSSDFIVEVMGWNSTDMVKVYNDLTAKEKKWKDLEKLKDHLTKTE